MEKDAQIETAPQVLAEGLSDWDIAVRYHEFKKQTQDPDEIRRLRTISARAVLERAREILGAIVHPTRVHTHPLSEQTVRMLDDEIELEETIENSINLLRQKLPLGPEDIWMESREKLRKGLILCVDTSLSMTGEKLALTGVALAVVFLQFPEDPLGIVAFESEAKVLKAPGETLELEELVQRFLDIPAQGYTNLEEGLRGALRLQSEIHRSGLAVHLSGPVSTLLLSDGKYTAGRDPGFLASSFPHLEVLKMGSERASRDICLELARLGQGGMQEITELEDLPIRMYGAVKDLLRGRALC